jgi:hypothetical protein
MHKTFCLKETFILLKTCPQIGQVIPDLLQKAGVVYSLQSRDPRKMEQYGIKGAALSCFRSYLSNRSQETKFYEKISDAINVLLVTNRGRGK